MNIRLDKYLADTGFGTRNEVRALVRSGVVTVNGERCKDSSMKVNTDSDSISVGGQQLSYSEYEYYMLHKPAGIITASRDKKEKTVLDYIKSKKRRDLFPVGRLDRDTEGLLLITNDGELGHRLLSPDRHVEKCYTAIVEGVGPRDIVEIFERGIDIGDDKNTKPAKLRHFSDMESFQISYNDDIIIDRYNALLENRDDASSELSIYEIKITEGRYHEIKRMFEAVGCSVVYLKRYSMGSLVLDKSLAPGEYRQLTDEEISSLKSKF